MKKNNIISIIILNNKVPRVMTKGTLLYFI